MKIYLLIITLSCFLLPVTANDEAYLDLKTDDIYQYKTFSPVFNNEKTEKSDDFDTDMIFHPFKYLRENAKELYSEKTVNNNK